MSVPEHLWRFPTPAAVASLALRFGLPHHPNMQDWEWEVADPSRIDEFLAAYDGELTDDERFTLMEILLQSFEIRARDHGFDARWSRLLRSLEENVLLHAHSIWYWSAIDDEDDASQPDDSEDHWLVTPHMRKILARHRGLLESGRGPEPATKGA